MKTKLFKLSCLSLLLFALPVHAENSDIVVSEIAAYESRGCEWIEISNTGDEAVNIEGWRFWEQDTNHRLHISSSSVQTDWNIDPGEYAIIAQNDTALFSLDCNNYTPPAGTVFDSSWGTLNESGELIGLKDENGVLVEEFTYIAAPNGSLERVDLALSDYTSANWTEQNDSNTFGTAFSQPSSTPLVAASVQLVVRYEDAFVFDGRIPLAPPTTSTLAILQAADATSTAFSLSDVVYYANFDSYLVNCIEIATSSPVNACYSWNYIVNGQHPQVGMDDYMLAANDVVYVYFSAPWRLTMPTTTVFTDTTTTFETWRYEYDNLAVPWAHDPRTQVTVSAPNPMPTGWWDAMLAVTTTVSDEFGVATVTMTATGTFSASITALDFSKWSAPVPFTVLDLPLETTTTTTSTAEQTTPPPANNGGSGGGGGSTAVIAVTKTVDAILNYLKSQTDATGKIVDGGTTDWAIISFAADGQYASDITHGGASLFDYALGYHISSSTEINPCAGYPRHLLALLAAGVPTASSTISLLVQNITDSACYADHHYGLPGINDDVFALLALLAANTPTDSPIIQDILMTVKSDQQTSGAFTWAGYPGTDITGAAVNALTYAEQKGISVSSSIFDNAKTYLQSQQLADGGWGYGTSDALTTSWALMGLNALDDGQTAWTNSAGKNPWHPMVEQLRPEGYYEPSWAPGTVDWFAVKHAVPALLQKSWPIILAPRVSTPASAEPLGGGTTGGGNGSGGFHIPPQPEELGSISSTPSATLSATTTPETPQTLPATSTPPATPQDEPPQQPPPAFVPSSDREKAGPRLPAPEPQADSEQTTVSSTIDTAPNAVQEAARRAFAGSASATMALGLYLVWRFFRMLV